MKTASILLVLALPATSADTGRSSRLRHVGEWTLYSNVEPCGDVAWKGREKSDYVLREGPPGEMSRRVFTLAGDGDSFCCWAGVRARVEASRGFSLSFDYRIRSNFVGSNVTNASVLLLDAQGRLLHRVSLVEGGTTDTGWKRYECSFVLGGSMEVTVILGTYDAWVANWEKTCDFRDPRVTEIKRGANPIVVRARP